MGGAVRAVILQHFAEGGGAASWRPDYGDLALKESNQDKGGKLVGLALGLMLLRMIGAQAGRAAWRPRRSRSSAHALGGARRRKRRRRPTTAPAAGGSTGDAGGGAVVVVAPHVPATGISRQRVARVSRVPLVRRGTHATRPADRARQLAVHVVVGLRRRRRLADAPSRPCGSTSSCRRWPPSPRSPPASRSSRAPLTTRSRSRELLSALRRRRWRAPLWRFVCGAPAHPLLLDGRRRAGGGRAFAGTAGAKVNGLIAPAFIKNRAAVQLVDMSPTPTRPPRSTSSPRCSASPCCAASPPRQDADTARRVRRAAGARRRRRRRPLPLHAAARRGARGRVGESRRARRRARARGAAASPGRRPRTPRRSRSSAV